MMLRGLILVMEALLLAVLLSLSPGCVVIL